MHTGLYVLRRRAGAGRAHSIAHIARRSPIAIDGASEKRARGAGAGKTHLPIRVDILGDFGEVLEAGQAGQRLAAVS